MEFPPIRPEQDNKVGGTEFSQPTSSEPGKQINGLANRTLRESQSYEGQARLDAGSVELSDDELTVDFQETVTGEAKRTKVGPRDKRPRKSYEVESGAIKQFLETPDQLFAYERVDAVHVARTYPALHRILTPEQMALLSDWDASLNADFEDAAPLFDDNASDPSLVRLNELLPKELFARFQLLAIEDFSPENAAAKTQLFFEACGLPEHGEEIGILLLDFWPVQADMEGITSLDYGGLTERNAENKTHWQTAFERDQPKLFNRLLSAGIHGVPAPLLTKPLVISGDLSGAQAKMRETASQHAIFMEAVATGDTDVITRLLDNGVNPDVRNPHGLSSLQVALAVARQGREAPLKSLETLAERGVRVSRYQSLQFHPLTMAIESKNERLMQAVLRCVDINARDYRGITLLQRAAAMGRHDIVKELHRLGAKLPQGCGIDGKGRLYRQLANDDPLVKQRVLELVVEPMKIVRTSNVGFSVSHQVSVRERGDPIQYFSGGLIGEHYTDLVINVIGEDGEEAPALLSDKMKAAALKVLLKGRPAAGYCCVDFFNDVFGLFNIYRVNNLIVDKYTYEKPQSADDWAPGDGVELRSASGEPRHWAVHLKDGLFISVLGGAGKLAIMTLPDMITEYGAPSYYRMNPRR